MKRAPLPPPRRFNPRFGRRTLLAGLGASAMVAPLLPALEALAEGGAPRRLILFFTPHGMVPDWVPTGSETDFTLSPILSPLETYKSDNLIVIQGLQMVGNGGGGPHTRGSPLVFTGSEQLPGDEFIHGNGDPTLGWGWNVSASVDQVVAAAFKAGTDPTPYTSLELGVKAGGGHPGNRINYAGPAQPVFPQQDPAKAFDAMFADFGQSEAEMEKLRARRLSALDLVGGELEAVRSKVGKDDQLKMEAHLDGVRELELRLEQPYACDPEPPGTPIADVQADENMPEVTSRHIQLIAQAFACDITRVATLQIRVGENDGSMYPWLDPAMEHHLTTHEPESNTAAWVLIDEIRTYYASKLRELMDALAAIPEVDGAGSMLDSTMIVWGSELAEGRSHSFMNMPFVIGGGKRFLKTGRFLTRQDVSHSRLLVAVLHAMGLTEYDTFGENDQGLGTGPLDGILI